jgi:hypothetical protein
MEDTMKQKELKKGAECEGGALLKGWIKLSGNYRVAV